MKDEWINGHCRKWKWTNHQQPIAPESGDLFHMFPLLCQKKNPMRSIRNEILIVVWKPFLVVFTLFIVILNNVLPVTKSNCKSDSSQVTLRFPLNIRLDDFCIKLCPSDKKLEMHLSIYIYIDMIYIYIYMCLPLLPQKSETICPVFHLWNPFTHGGEAAAISCQTSRYLGSISQQYPSVRLFQTAPVFAERLLEVSIFRRHQWANCLGLSSLNGTKTASRPMLFLKGPSSRRRWPEQFA